MYKSIKKWLNLPAEIYPFIKRNGTGTKIYAEESISIKCYVAGKVVVVTDNTGTEVVSNRQLYMDGNIPLNELDKVMFDGRECPIKSISTFYRNGKPDIKVVYM